MKYNGQEIAEETFEHIVEYIEEVKELLLSDVWENVFLNCSKNEVLIFWLLYRKKEVNMTEIAEYIHVPLNTATGIINRMEKSGLIIRTRSKEDKRVVIIGFSEEGMGQFQKLIQKMMQYGMQVLGSFTKEEMELFYKMATKVKAILKQENKPKETTRRIRKIPIE